MAGTKTMFHGNSMTCLISLVVLCIYSQRSPTISFFDGVESFSTERLGHRSLRVLGASEKDDAEVAFTSLSSFKDSDGASKGIVGSLTGIVNKVSAVTGGIRDTERDLSEGSPKSPEELMDRIRKDYVERNYLWTGDLDLDCFETTCVFTDPTISFVGTDKFTENTQNLVPIVEAFAKDYRSDLLSIDTGRGKSSIDYEDDEEVYIETRWNMVGSLTASPWLFWKPKIDVIGRTKFWFRKQSDTEGFQVYFYDESWEVPAWKALLQIVTPEGTFPSTNTSL